ncbi:type IV toxin-antitoxin system AbiEi family antitoxin domain-containing protein [Solicola gregarius]|uniref:Type IV toxin-antitoxin system AbiEi family antitoxin domain-containing protein n=1 Tax=Solicola gregarius TaxID=2908642 RepID=A0AA46TH08_9ACTN|nr:type IV toxin-antitoxin system AbiEi family antitoxin domain-containing protein [Solicola gregarius]UYM05028.1 type IV toxin-antitoxin system AbiEi family antitoxin domain-containing protein [Solicola gregarius]
MSDSFRSWVSRRGGFFSRAEAKDCGFSDRDIQGAVRSGRWIRLRRGYYAYAEYVAELDPPARHWLLARAVLHRLGERYVAVGVTACIAHGIDTWGADLATVHVARLDHRSSIREAGVAFHDMPVDGGRDVVSVDGVPVIRPARAVWQASCELSTEGAFVCMNSAQHKRCVDEPELYRVGESFERWPGSRTARLAFWLSDSRIETVGESRTYFLCWEFHLPRPQPQFEVYNANGRLIARTDFAWVEARHVAEFDGKVKYLRYLRPGETVSEAIVREKRREDLVRAERFGMSRVVWLDVEGRNRPRTAYALQDSIDQSARLYTRNRTTIVA